MTTDITEKGLETLIFRHMTGADGLAVAPNSVAETPAASGTGYHAGSPQDYDRAHSLDTAQLFAFLQATQPEAFKKLGLGSATDTSGLPPLSWTPRLARQCPQEGRGSCTLTRAADAELPASLPQ